MKNHGRKTHMDARAGYLLQVFERRGRVVRKQIAQHQARLTRATGRTEGNLDLTYANRVIRATGTQYARQRAGS